MSRKSRERQLWVDLDFADSLKRIKGNRLSKTGEEYSYGQITKEIAKSNDFKKIEKQLSEERISFDEDFMRGLTFKLRKRGSVVDGFLYMIVAIGIILLCVGALFFAKEIYSTLSDNSLTLGHSIGSGNMNITIGQMGSTVGAFSIFRWLALVFIVALMLGMFISAYYIKASPVMFAIYILVSLVVIAVSPSLSNAYDIIKTNSMLEATFSDFWGVNFIMEHLPVWMIVITFITGVIMYAGMKRGIEG